MGKLEEKEDGLSATSRPHSARSMYRCIYRPTVTLMIVIVNSVLIDYLFQAVKDHLYSSSDVQEVVLSTVLTVNCTVSDQEDANVRCHFCSSNLKFMSHV
jgi:hypothetical protein